MENEKQLINFNQPVATLRRLNDALSSDYVRRIFKDLTVNEDAIRRLKRIAALAISRNKKLLDCTMASVIGVVAESMRLNLEINDARGSLFIVPFRRQRDNFVFYEAVPLIGYQGLIQLAYRSGVVNSIYADVIFENDSFEFQLGTDPFLKHVPAVDNRGNMLLAYGYCRLANSNNVILHIVNRQDIKRHRGASQAKDSELWTTHEVWAWRKTAIRELVKFLPPCDFSTLVARDSELEAGAKTGSDIFNEYSTISEIEEDEYEDHNQQDTDIE